MLEAIVQDGGICLSKYLKRDHQALILLAIDTSRICIFKQFNISQITMRNNIRMGNYSGPFLAIPCPNLARREPLTPKT